MKNKILISMILMLGFAFQIDAQREFRGQCQRGSIQKQRIREGVKSGDLTRPEVRQLAKQNRRIEKAKRHAAADGKITKAERRQLKQMKKHQNATIYRQKHDRERRNF